MTGMLRRLTSTRHGKSGMKDQTMSNNEWLEKCLTKERDKLLEEFLEARTELKEQFNIEKQEIISNYERRNRYLRRLLEQCDENMNMLKLDLDAEKEENYSLRTKVMELENLCMKANKSHTPASYYNKSFEDDVTLTNDDDSKNYNEYRESSSISGLKYSDKSSYDSLYKSSMTSLSSIDASILSSHQDIHFNCREEFNCLLDELRNQKSLFDEKLEEEKIRMRERIEDEKLQLERIVFKQLNLKIEKEIKKREFLVTENNHLQQTISRKITDSLSDSRNTFLQTPLKEDWKESNSDSGADVEDNRSDEELCSPPLLYKQRALNMNELLNQLNLTHEEDVTKNSISRLLNEQKVKLNSEFQKQISREKKKYKRIVESLHNQIITLTKEIKVLRKNTANRTSCINEVSEFHMELSERLLDLEELLSEDPDAC